MSGSLELLAEAIRRESGIGIRSGRLEVLRAALGRAAPGLDPAAAVQVVAGRGAGRRLLERLIDEVAVKETFFLREPHQLRRIDWPALVAAAGRQGARRARVWSAGCATGEEPYTLAMLACDALGSMHPPVAIVGTDISSSALAVARRGRYGRSPLRSLDAATIQRHLRREDGEFVVRDALRELVEFRPHNLALDSRPPEGQGPFELAVCRNVLIYLDPGAVDHALRSLERALQPDGVLLLGAADRLCVPRGASGSQRLLGHPAPPPPEPRGEPDDAEQTGQVRAALSAVEAGSLGLARAAADEALAADPFNPEGHFVRGTVELAAGDARAAVQSLRSALYVEPTFALAAFQLGRAYEALADRGAARRAYERALRTSELDDLRHGELLGGLDLMDVTAACSMRLRALGT